MNQVPESHVPRRVHMAHKSHLAEERLRERMSEARDIATELREKVEVAVREKPYMVAAASCAIGVGIGVLVGSKLTRFLAFAAVGGLLSDTIGGEVKRLARDVVRDFQERLDETADEDDGELLG